MPVQIQLRRGTAAEWTAANPVLAAGEIGVETDATPVKFKMGDGSTAWSSLAYGFKGDPGADGTNGVDGVDGVGVPSGGSTGEVLAKIDGSDFNTEWVAPGTGGGSGVAEDLSTAETDTTKVLAPDGTGHVQFRDEAGGAATLDALLALSTGQDTADALTGAAAPAAGNVFATMADVPAPVDIASDAAAIAGINFTVQGSDPATPGSGHAVVYVKADGAYIILDDETVIGPFAVADITDLPTVEMDTTLVFAPDGTGHVQARAETGGGGTLASASYKRTTGDYTTSSTTFVDVDGTNLSLTITTDAHRVMIALAGSCYHSNGSGGFVALDVAVDGTRVGGDFGLVFIQPQSANAPRNASFVYITDVLSAGSHTFTLQWAVSGATGGLAGNTNGGTGSGIALRFAVVEQAA